MKYHTHTHLHSISRWQSNFINLPCPERKFINSQYVNSKFLRIWSNVAYSAGIFYHCEEIDNYTNLTRIENINIYMESVYNLHKEIFEKVKLYPDMTEKFKQMFRE